MNQNITPKRFGLIGAAGYVAPRHMQAIKEIGGDLLTACDPSDSVGVIDRYFPETQFFVNFSAFAKHVEHLKKNGRKLDYISICSPNHLHKEHVTFVLRSGCNAVCEKPVVLEPTDIDDLIELQTATGRSVNTVLQLRLYPAMVKLRDQIASDKTDRVHDVELTYITSRGRWYHESWKGDITRSGGIATNIGVHFFDLLHFLFGALKKNIVHHRAADCAGGYLEFDRARVRWFLSINRDHIRSADSVAHRSIHLKDLGYCDFSTGFENLHSKTYSEVIEGRGFTLEDVRPSIETVSYIRHAPITPELELQHPRLSALRMGSERVAHDQSV